MSRAAVQRQQTTKIRLAVGFGALGSAILAILVWMPWQTFPDLRLWIPFAAAFVYFEWHNPGGLKREDVARVGVARVFDTNAAFFVDQKVGEDIQGLLRSHGYQDFIA